MNDKDYSKVEEYTRHGGPYDRGSADSWYSRGRNPHYFKGATYRTEEVKEKDMTLDEVAAYNQGYDDNEESGGHKEWN